MGAGFVLLIIAFVALVCSIVLGLVAGLITFFVSKKEYKLRKVLLAGISPLIFIFSLYFISLTLFIVIYSNKGVDIGIGDTWRIPLNEKYELLFIDYPESVSIRKSNFSIIREIKDIQQNDSLVYIKTQNELYYSLNLKTDSLIEHKNKEEFISKNPTLAVNLIAAIDFYHLKKSEIVGYSNIIIWLFSFMVSTLIILLLAKLILKK